jgi:hypothetical protein
MTKTYNKTNFHKHTFCIFQKVNLELVKDLKLHYKSKSGSSYYFVEDGVYRLSNHWSRVANCRWRIVANKSIPPNSIEVSNPNRIKLGFAKWHDFHQDNDFEKHYFIEFNKQNEVNYFHKNSGNYTNQELRTSVETTKIIKQIRTLLEETAWAKYLKSDTIEDVRQKIIQQLIYTKKTFQEIRKEYL